jgi:hypothetical protein
MPVDPNAPELVEPGEEPRAELRYDPRAGKTRTLELDVDSAEVFQNGNVEDPHWHVVATIETMTVEHGVFSTRVRYTDTEVVGGNEVMRQLASDQLAPLEGTIGLARFTELGQRLSFEPASTTNASAKTVLQVINGYGTGDLASLPTEPVGRGARWKVRVPSGPVMVPATADIELAEVAGTRVHLTGTVSVDETANALTLRGTGKLDVVTDLVTLTGTTTLTLEVTATDTRGTETRSIEEVRVTTR